jgi:hypothetical protein
MMRMSSGVVVVRDAVAVEFHEGEVGALREATSWPLT